MTHLNRMLERFTDVQALRVTGGPTHSDVWMQMLADVSGLAIALPQVEETGCSGAALAARSAPAFIPIFTQRSTRSDTTFGSLNPTCTPMRPISASISATSY